MPRSHTDEKNGIEKRRRRHTKSGRGPVLRMTSSAGDGKDSKIKQNNIQQKTHGNGLKDDSAHSVTSENPNLLACR